MIKLKNILFCLFLFFSLGLKAYGWWDVPHMIITQIAKNQLDPAAIEKIEALVRYFEDDFTRSSSMITASCFADDITPLGLSGFKVWHGILKPYCPNHFLETKEIDRIDALIKENNLHSAIRQSMATLKNPLAGKWEKCFLLRFLLHAVGDIHQPLHCIQLYSPEFPLGDLAGHSFMISGVPYRNLHLLWDSAFGIGNAKFERPLSQCDLETLQSLSELVSIAYPPESLPEMENGDIEEWSKESYDLAIKFAYADLKPGQVPSQQYLVQGEKVVQRQIALAGYRLAHLLKTIFCGDE